jgi:hypothetical protein
MVKYLAFHLIFFFSIISLHLHAPPSPSAIPLPCQSPEARLSQSGQCECEPSKKNWQKNYIYNVIYKMINFTITVKCVNFMSTGSDKKPVPVPKFTCM